VTFHRNTEQTKKGGDDDLGRLFTGVAAVFTCVIAVFTFLVWRTYERMAFFTGAMESHSELMLRLQRIDLSAALKRAR
jgi:hypothetical protein